MPIGRMISPSPFGSQPQRAMAANDPIKPMQSPMGNKYFGIHPITGRPITDEKEAMELRDPTSGRGQGLMSQIYSPQGADIVAMRQKLLQMQQG